MALPSGNPRAAWWALAALVFLALVVHQSDVGSHVIKLDVGYRLRRVAYGDDARKSEARSDDYGQDNGLEVFETRLSDDGSGEKLLVATSTADALKFREPGGFGDKDDLIPIVLFYWADEIGPKHYSWQTMRPAVAHGNKILLITNAVLHPPPDLEGKFERVEAKDLKTEKLAKFISTYKGWGSQEPWESFNFRRFFFLQELMRQRNLETVFFADSDVAVITQLRKSALIIPGCDAYMDTRVTTPLTTVRTLRYRNYYWSAWAGSSIMTKGVLDEWVDFTLEMYGNKEKNYVRKVLAKKNLKKPFVCDMTLWYLYLIAADEQFFKLSQIPDRNMLPQAPKRRLCASATMGFDHSLAYRKTGFEIKRKHHTATLDGKPLLSIHFQGKTGKNALKWKNFWNEPLE